MTPGKAIVAAVCCVVLVLVLVWLQRTEKAEARERAMAQPPEPVLPPPTRFEFTRALDQAEMPAIEQLELTQDERDALVEGLYEWIGELEASPDTAEEPKP